MKLFKMLRIKKLDIFIVKSFLQLFIGTFFICLFIFMMQFLWRYVDDLIGKGLDMNVLGQFFFYSALTLVPIALPLAILLASLITFGNFGERYELLAMKAAGISLFNIMRPLVGIVCGLVIVSFYFQNVISPKAFEKLGTLVISMKMKSPELDIPEGVFYSGIPDYSLKIAKKDKETGMLYDVLIYSLRDGFENAHVIYADSGRMEMTADKQHLWLHLYDGDLFENLKAQNMGSESVPYRRESFREKHTIIEFNSDFNMADASVMSNNSTTKNMETLSASIDSMQVLSDSIGKEYYKELSKGTFAPPSGLTAADTLKIKKADLKKYNIDSLFYAMSLLDKQKVISSAQSRVQSLESDLSFKSSNIGNNDYSIRKHKTEWHKKITISLSCLLFFFIGAPLGGIIRKGGLGMPVIISVLTFIIYYVIDNSGYKLARDGKWIAWMGMWTSTAVLLPLGAFLTYKSNTDSVVLNTDAYRLWIKTILGIRTDRHIVRKEVIINDPNYHRLPDDLHLLSQQCAKYLDINRLRKAPNYFKLYFASANGDNEAKTINEFMEQLIDEMSNTKSTVLLALINKYPVIPPTAHLHPFENSWLNLSIGAILPIGLFFYFRIWIFRYRLSKDIDMILKNNAEALIIIEDIKQKYYGTNQTR